MYTVAGASGSSACASLTASGPTLPSHSTNPLTKPWLMCCTTRIGTRKPAGSAASSPASAAGPPVLAATARTFICPAFGTPRGVPKAGQIKVLAVAASTGGPAALAGLLAALPAGFRVPILVVQHISHGFVNGLVEWLGKVGPLAVKLAQADEPLAPATVYIAPDDHHLGMTAHGRV